MYRPEVDGLRAIAVVAVILYHAKWSLFSGGFVGVDIFFVISGYLITTLILSDRSRNEFSFKIFYARRVRRLFPALIVVVVISFLFAWGLMVPEEIKSFGQSVVSISLFSSNLFFWWKTDYFSPLTEEQPLLHTWSLSLEEQFYLIYPLLLLFLCKMKPKKVFIALSFLTVFSFLCSRMLNGNLSSAAFYLLPFRSWELLAGALLAIIPLSRAERIRSIFPSDLLAFFGLFLIIYSIVVFDKSAAFPSHLTLVPVIGACLVIFFATGHTLSARFFAKRVMVFLGLMSYSLYLYHQPIFAFSRIVYGDELSNINIVLCIAITFFLGFLSWRFVEKPFRLMQLDRSVLVVLSGVMALCALGVAGFLFSTKVDGFLKSNASNDGLKLLETVEYSPYRSVCHRSDSSVNSIEDFCVYPTGSSPSMAVFGDSHGVEPAYAMGESGLFDGVAHFTYSGCGPVSPDLDLDVSSSGCQKWSVQTQKFIASQVTISHVYIFYRVVASVCGDHRNYFPLVPVDCDYDVLKSLKNTVTLFKSGGKKVTVILQVPELPREAASVLLRSNLTTKNQVVRGVTREWWDKRSALIFSRIKYELGFYANVFDPTDIFCNSVDCFLNDSDGIFYFDDDHLSLHGSTYLAKHLSKLTTVE